MIIAVQVFLGGSSLALWSCWSSLGIFFDCVELINHVSNEESTCEDLSEGQAQDESQLVKASNLS